MSITDDERGIVYRFDVDNDSYAVVIGQNDRLELWACAPSEELEPQQRVTALELRMLLARTGRWFHGVRAAAALIEIHELEP